jgi:NCAIR mutase (PurE)-related protein
MSERNETAIDFAVHMDHIRSHRFGFVIKLDHGGKVFQRTAHILKCHIVKMKTANLFVSEKNLRSLSNIGELSDFQNRGEEEIVRMKSEKFSNANVSFYDILTKGISQLKMYEGNESVVQILRSDVCKVNFPIYASMINSNFRKGVRRKQMLEQGHEIFRSFFNNFPQ